MAQQAPQLSEELQAAIFADAEELANLFKTTCTEEQKEATRIRAEEWKSNPDFKVQKMA